MVGLRTSTHAFKYDKNKANDPFAKYDFRFAGTDFKGGFGEQILGQSWVGHYGQNHRQSTRIDLVPEKKESSNFKRRQQGACQGRWLQRRSSTRLEYSNHGSTSYVDGAEWKKTIHRNHPWLASGLVPTMPRTEKRAGCLHPCTERQWIWLIRATGD